MSDCCCGCVEGCESAAAIAADLAAFIEAGETITLAGRHAVALAEQREA